MSEHTCPLCSGIGKTKLNITNFFIGSVNNYMFITPKGEEKHRARIEVSKELVNSFLDKFDSKDQVAFFVIPLNEFNKGSNIEEFVESMENDENE